jgi:acyl carrier protein
MSDVDVFEVLVGVIREETNSPDIEIDEDTTAADVPGWDSLAHVRIVMNVEVSLGVTIEMSDTYTAADVGELVQIIQNSIKAAGTSSAP